MSTDDPTDNVVFIQTPELTEVPYSVEWERSDKFLNAMKHVAQEAGVSPGEFCAHLILLQRRMEESLLENGGNLQDASIAHIYGNDLYCTGRG